MDRAVLERGAPRRTRDRLLELEPDASKPCGWRRSRTTWSVISPGGPKQNLAVPPEDDMEYRRLHSERSAAIVGDWLRGEAADEGLVAEVERLILAHELGGAPDEDLLHAADSISFIETTSTCRRAGRPRASAP